MPSHLNHPEVDSVVALSADTRLCKQHQYLAPQTLHRPTWKLGPLNNSSPFLPSTNPRSPVFTFLLYGVGYSGYLLAVELHRACLCGWLVSLSLVFSRIIRQSPSLQRLNAFYCVHTPTLLKGQPRAVVNNAGPTTGARILV